MVRARDRVIRAGPLFSQRRKPRNHVTTQYAPFETTLQSVYDQAQSHILHVYFDEYHLFAMLRLLHQFYLLAAGDFYLEFISRVDSGFLTAPTEVSNGWLQEEFNNCVHRTSLASQFEFLSQHVRLNRLRALSPFDMWKSPFFTVECEPNLRVIFSKVEMAKYEQIFAFLMSFKTQSFVVQKIWIDQCCLSKELDRVNIVEIESVLDAFNLLRMKIQSFLTTLQNFYFLHIIDKLYNQMISKLKTVKRFDSILELHNEYLDSLCHYFFVGNEKHSIRILLFDLLEQSRVFVGLQVAIALLKA